jgi:hypothetical protein
MMGSGTTKISKQFNEEVDSCTTSIFSASTQSSLSKYSGRVLELMADGLESSIHAKSLTRKSKTY